MELDRNHYFYRFLEPISKELAYVARELENSIFTSPRTMLTHARVLVENILHKVIQIEKLRVEPRSNFNDKIQLLNRSGLIDAETLENLHEVRKLGNAAAHEPRTFKFSEALKSWESIYEIVKWYVEGYGPLQIEVPDYRDPAIQINRAFDIAEIQERLKNVEELLITSLGTSNENTERTIDEETDVSLASKEVAVSHDGNDLELPGFTTIRTISFKDQQLEIPYFLRDAFLLPQRFEKSETFLIRLGAEQQARIMSELPNNLEGLHRYVKRYNERHEEIFFEELKQFILEEKARRRIMMERPGELFFFFKSDYIIVTEELSKIPLTTDEFSGFPNLLKQMNEDQMTRVEHLPRELVLLAKYKNVGINTVEKLFKQLKEKQKEKPESCV